MPLSFLVGFFSKIGGPILAGLKMMIMVSAGMFVMRALAALGMYFFVLQPATEQVVIIMTTGFTGLPGSLAAWIAFFKIPDFFSLVVSAYTIAFVARVVLARPAPA